MENIDLEKLNVSVAKAKASIKKSESLADIKADICSVWSKVKPVIVFLESAPFGVGTAFKALAAVLDAVCGN